MADAIISRIRNFLNSGDVKESLNDNPRAFTRYMGGWARQNYPYINGYWQMIIQPPRPIFGDLLELAQTWFLSTAEGFTPPSRNLKKVDVPGQGGMDSSFVAGQTLNRTFSTTHREYTKLSMLKMIRMWSNVIDSTVGVSEIPADIWVPASYKGLMYIIVTKPTGAGKSAIDESDVEEVYLFDGVWPDSEPIDALNQDISTNDSIVLNINWNFDGWPLNQHDSNVLENALQLANSIAGSGYQAHFDNMISDIGLSNNNN